MKKTFLRFVSTALATLMLFGSVNLGVFAVDHNAPAVVSSEFSRRLAVDLINIVLLCAGKGDLFVDLVKRDHEILQVHALLDNDVAVYHGRFVALDAQSDRRLRGT